MASRSRRDGVRIEQLAVRLNESKCAIVEDLDLHSAFMNQAMVEAAERDEIREFCFAAVGPVFDVMTVSPFRVAAAGKSAALVSRVESASESRWNTPSFSSNIEWIAKGARVRTLRD